MSSDSEEKRTNEHYHKKNNVQARTILGILKVEFALTERKVVELLEENAGHLVTASHLTHVKAGSHSASDELLVALNKVLERESLAVRVLRTCKGPRTRFGHAEKLEMSRAIRGAIEVLRRGGEPRLRFPEGIFAALFQWGPLTLIALPGSQLNKENAPQLIHELNELIASVQQRFPSNDYDAGSDGCSKTHA